MNQYKLMFLGITLLLSFGAVTAQNKTRKEQELSVYGKGIFSSIKYDIPEGAELHNDFGAGLGLQYALYLNSNWSISAGLEYQQYRSEAILTGFNDSYTTTDAEGTDFDFRPSADIYKEKQWVDMVNIPIMLRYETPTPLSNSSIYSAIGFKYGIPVSAKYMATAKNLKTSGYFQQWDATLDGPAFMGFGSWGTIQSSKQELDIRSNYSFLLEAGLKQQLNKKQSLNVGFYADLGLNNLTKRNTPSLALIEYNVNNPTEFGLNPMFYSTLHAQGETYAVNPKIRGFGIKILYAFKL